jgi:hypothetical protein
VPSTDHPDGDPAALEDPELEDEELEYEDDGYYEDELVLLTPRPEFGPELDRAGVLARTRETLALLRHMRRAHLREQAGNVAFAAYAAVLCLFIYGGALLPWLRSLSHGQPQSPDAVAALAAAPPALVALQLLLVLAVLRDALWRGPVTVPAPTAGWLLSLPLDRGRLLRPRFRFSVALGIILGALAGAAQGLALAAAGLAHTRGLMALVLWGALGGALLGLAAVGAAVLVERYPVGEKAVRIAGPIVALVSLALVGQAVLAWYRDVPAWVSTVELWSGPWGWASQPLVAAAGGSAASAAGASGPLGASGVVSASGAVVALLPLALLAVALVVVGDRLAPGISGAALRARARAVQSFTAAVVTMNPRTAAEVVRSTRVRRRRVRLPLPKRPAWTIVWRDATGLLRAPSRLAWAVLLLATGFVLGAMSTHAKLYPSLALLAGALVAGYLAVAQLLEPARLDADDPRRAGHLPYRFDRLALRHLVLPLVLAGVLAEAAVAVLAGVTGSWTLLAVPPLALPALVAAALVSAYRGPVPASIQLGADTPLGNTGLLQVAGWYAAGPLTATILLLPPAHAVIGRTPAPETLLNYVLWGLAVAALLTFWAVRRASKRAASVNG